MNHTTFTDNNESFQATFIVLKDFQKVSRENFDVQKRVNLIQFYDVFSILTTRHSRVLHNCPQMQATEFFLFGKSIEQQVIKGSDEALHHLK